jgi:hypothetical protein
MKDEDINIMDIDVNNLKQKQYIYLKQHTKNILENILKDLEADDLISIQNYLVFSPDGDGWGKENYFINFSYKDNEEMDLQEIINKMKELKGDNN